MKKIAKPDMVIRCAYTERVALDKLKPHPENPNYHPPEQIRQLAKIMKYQGVRNPIVVSKRSGLITRGHGRLEAARLNGWVEFPVDRQSYENEAQEIADLIADNTIAELAELKQEKVDQLALKLPRDFDLTLLAIPEYKLPVVPGGAGAEGGGILGEDEIPFVPQIPRARLGDLFELGGHRVLCGDATKREDVERLMAGEKLHLIFTDPPYGMALDTDYSKIKGSNKAAEGFTPKKHAPVAGDDKPFDPRPIFELFPAVPEVFLWGADYYCQRLPEKGGWLVWDKTGGHDSLMNAGFSSNFELCWSKQRHKRDLARITWKGAMGRANEETVHPTQKPAALAQWFFERWGKEARNIWDGYLGSGSTLIACEKTLRRCFGMEIEPLYVDVILDRWEKYTGKQAYRLEAGGKKTAWKDIKPQKAGQ